MLLDCYQLGLWLMRGLSLHYAAALQAGDWLALALSPLAAVLVTAGWLVAMSWPILPFLLILGEPRRASVGRAVR
jgi:hypothetical protein